MALLHTNGKNTQVGIASPNPSYPQEIEVVRGKNLFDKEGSIIRGGRLDNIGAIRYETGYYTSEFIPVTPNIAYTKNSPIADAYHKFCFYETNNATSFISQVIDNNTVVTPSNCNYIRFCGLLSELDTAQLEKGSQATSYLPYNTLEITKRGKNLVPFPYSSQAGLISGVNWSVNADGTINANGTADNTSSIFYLCNGDDDLYLDPGTYKVSTNVFTDANGFGIQAIQMVNGSYGTVYFNDMVLTERTRLRVRILAKANAVVNQTNGYLMIEKGSTATDYEPYITPITQQLSLGEYEFARIGNYVDTIEYDVDNDKVYKNKNVKKIASYNGETISTDYISTTGQLTTGATIYYGITEVKEEITGTLATQIKALYNSQSFTGTTIITSNGELPLVLKVRALKGE